MNQISFTLLFSPLLPLSRLNPLEFFNFSCVNLLLTPFNSIIQLFFFVFNVIFVRFLAHFLLPLFSFYSRPFLEISRQFFFIYNYNFLYLHLTPTYFFYLHISHLCFLNFHINPSYSLLFFFYIDRSMSFIYTLALIFL